MHNFTICTVSTILYTEQYARYLLFYTQTLSTTCTYYFIHRKICTVPTILYTHTVQNVPTILYTEQYVPTISCTVKCTLYILQVIPTWLIDVSGWLYYVSPAIDPVIYTLRNQSLRSVNFTLSFSLSAT